MHLLEQKILSDAKVLEGNVLKVDSFINHQIDIGLTYELSREFHRLFLNCNVNKILTIESSGIGIACFTAQFFSCPMVFAKKSKSLNISDSVYTAEVESFTKKTKYTLMVSKEFLSPRDRVLIIDDFLATGSALNALTEIIENAGAQIVGAGIVIEKAFQGGGDKLREKGIRIESLARIASMDHINGIRFC